MNKEYTLKSVRPLGDNDPKFGQTYWADTHDQLEPVMFNLLNGSVGEGARITAETVELKTSAKGTRYHRLKKIKVLGGSQASQTPAVANDTGKTLELILENTQKILKLVDKSQPTLSESWKQTTDQSLTPVPDVVVEDIGDGPIDLSDIPF